ncbi:MAG: hypothetical protein K9G60_06485 [Pseudolabrys sp.]|nr:hypothetical protein [Pseudolabrys sp.]
MKLPPVPPIAPAHIPLLLLLTVAAAVCLLLIAELRGRLTALPATLPNNTTPRQRLAASLGSLLVIALASVALFLIGGFVGLNYGPFYLIMAAVAALAAIFTTLGVARVAVAFERMSTAQLTWRATALVVGCLVLALLYEMAAGQAGLLPSAG